jgi:hypothetical protein
MSPYRLPKNTWLVVERASPDDPPTLISRHASCSEAEAERDRRNRRAVDPRFEACIVLEPIAQHMGGRHSPAARLG